MPYVFFQSRHLQANIFHSLANKAALTLVDAFLVALPSMLFFPWDALHSLSACFVRLLGLLVAFAENIFTFPHCKHFIAYETEEI